MSEPLNEILNDIMAAEVASWGAVSPACMLVSVDGPVASAGPIDLVLQWASITKILAALAVLDVVQQGLLDLDEPAGPPGSTVRHLLGHASGLAFDSERVVAKPGTRRIYSNAGIDVAVAVAVRHSGAPNAATLLRERVLGPLGMAGTRLDGPASRGACGPVRDLALLAHELLVPQRLAAAVVASAVAPSFFGLAGMLPGFGRQAPNDWGLGVERHGHKSPHWMAPDSPPDCIGHFGQSGSFLWADRTLGLAAVAATGTPFGPWAAEAWPRSSARWRRAWLATEAVVTSAVRL